MSRNTLDLFSSMDKTFKKKNFNTEEQELFKGGGSASFNVGKTQIIGSIVRRSSSDDITDGSGPANGLSVDIGGATVPSAAPLSPLSFQNITLDAEEESKMQLHREYLRGFSEEVGSAEILFDSANDERLLIVAGTTDKLIEYTTNERTDNDYCIPFLLTYRYHCDGEHVLAQLNELYDAAETEEVMIRVVNVIKKWIENLFPDFTQDKKLMGALITFIGKKLPATGNLELARQLQRDIQAVTAARQELKYDSSINTNVPKPSIPKLKEGEKVDFFDLSPGEIARQLTIMDYAMYREAPIVEFMKQAWNSKDPEASAPFVTKKIKFFNEISYWVATEILFQPDLKKRVSVIKRMIHVAEKCLEYHNFNTAMAITAGLHLSSISRLKRTWKHVPTKSIEVFESITKLMATEGNYKFYRSNIEKAVPPINPYIGIFLRDLTFIEVGNPDLIDKLVNFDKLRMVASVLRDVIKFQQTPYEFEAVPSIQEYLKQSVKLQDQALLKYSLLHEPPGGGDEKKRREH